VEKFHGQFCADLDADEAALMGATQRPVTERALTDGLTGRHAWRSLPSWFVYRGRDATGPVPATSARAGGTSAS
jgi:hypothetical protein